ncbi:cupin domain-containing protein [Deinococcus yavapaiensis]|uniref:Cupin type-2 domain-containing protein n=1 Tax=Deinococcus yavapaiensis KR-236 TaxID=694435 RepID=A0A318S9T0_9DEIO|nr:cupin domain-containing protein [Deinococcus yavapaiensis]PYE54988.1 hypothetical protein DES52_104262 [Deinococcus yavapaiensis KR-236]
MTVTNFAPESTEQSPLRISNPVSRDTVTFVRRTDGTCDTLLDLEVAPGGGLGLHFHDAYSESFTCVSGVFGVQVGARVVRLRPGESATADIGSAHRWFNDGDETAVARVTVAPGNPGLEAGLIVLYGLARDGLLSPDGTPKSLVHLAVLTDLTNSRVPGLLGVLNPVLRAVANWAKRRGVDRELLARYGA